MSAPKIPAYLVGSVSQYSGQPLTEVYVECSGYGPSGIVEQAPSTDTFGAVFWEEQAQAMRSEVQQCAARGFGIMAELLNTIASGYKANSLDCS